MHGISTFGATHTYTDIGGDRITLDSIEDEGRGIVALSMSGGHVVYLDVEHVDQFIAAIRATAEKAREVLAAA